MTEPTNEDGEDETDVQFDADTTIDARDPDAEDQVVGVDVARDNDDEEDDARTDGGVPAMDLDDVIPLAQATVDTRNPASCQHRDVGENRRPVKCGRDADFQFVYDVDGQDGVQRVDYCWLHAIPLPRDDFDLPPVCAKGHGVLRDEGDGDTTRWTCPDCGGVWANGPVPAARTDRMAATPGDQDGDEGAGE